jgi:hypothetical protein
MTQDYDFFTSDAGVRAPSQDHDTNTDGIGNSDLQALPKSILSCNAGSSAPNDPTAGVPFDGMFWMDTSARLLKIYSDTKTGGAGWVDLFEVNDGTPVAAPVVGTPDSWPVGSVYLQANGPSVNHAFGTWVPFAPGRFLAGVGEGSDPSGSWTIAEGVDGGQRFITLNGTNIPPHTHPFSVPGVRDWNVSGPIGSPQTVNQRSGSFSGTTSVQSGATGQAFDGMSPYTAVYAWRRTA